MRTFVKIGSLTGLTAVCFVTDGINAGRWISGGTKGSVFSVLPVKDSVISLPKRYLQRSVYCRWNPDSIIDESPPFFSSMVRSSPSKTYTASFKKPFTMGFLKRSSSAISLAASTERHSLSKL